MPGVVFFGVFAIVPLIGVGYLSLTDWTGIGTPSFIGFQNWSTLARDPRLGQSVTVTAILLFGSILVQTPVALLLGVWAAAPNRNRAVLSSIFFVPLLLSSAATSIMWRQLIDPNFGIPAQFSSILGANVSFLGTRWGAITAIIFVSSWQFIPFHTLIYQGAARSISETLYQAAAIDGAGRVRAFFAITLPQLRNTMITSTVLMVIGGLTAFDTVLILTRGGPGTETATLPYLMYSDAFKRYNMGYGSTIALVLVVLATGISFLMVKLSGYDRMTSTQEGL